MKYENLLPVGSVVLLRGADKRVVIVGRIQAMEGSDKIYDYSACPFPEGLVSSDSFVFFDHEAIERLYFIGFQDEEELRFRAERLGTLGELYIGVDGGIFEREVGDESSEPEVAAFAEVGD